MARNECSKAMWLCQFLAFVFVYISCIYMCNTHVHTNVTSYRKVCNVQILDIHY